MSLSNPRTRRHDVGAARDRSLARLVRITCILFFVVLLGLLGAAGRWTFNGTVAEAERAALDLTRTADSQLTRILEQADLLLLEQRDIAVTTDWSDPRQAAAVSERLSQRTHVLPYVFRLFIVGPDGMSLASSASPSVPISAADREYFRAQKEGDRGLYISDALRSKSDGEPIVVFSRRISDVNGSFRGVVVVSFNLDTLAGFFRRLPLQYAPVVQLVGSNMQILVSEPAWPAAAANQIREPLRTQMQEKVAGISTLPSQDGVDRIWAYRSLTPYPLYVRAGIDRSEVTSQWWKQTLPYFAFAVPALGSLFALSVFALQRARNEDRFRTALVDVNARLEDRVNERTKTLEDTNRRLTEAIDSLGEKSRTLETINRINSSIAAEIGLERLVQAVTDAATEITGARYGAFFYNIGEHLDGSPVAYARSGASPEGFVDTRLLGDTGILGATFAGQGVVRSNDIVTDPRFAQDRAPDNLTTELVRSLRSLLAVPVVARSGEVIGGLVFGHPDPGAFSDRAEEIVIAVAAQTAIAYDKAQLYRAAEMEIARRTETENALRESESRFRSLADSMPQIVWTATPDGWPNYYNLRWYDYTGLPPGELSRWDGVLHPGDKKATLEAWRTSLTSGERCEVEYRLKSHSGDFRWHLARALPVRNPYGEIVQWLATCTDIDDLKQAEEDLAHHRDELASHANKLAQALEDREILFKEVHHRVKNNLQVICSLVRMQANRVADPAAKSALEDTYNRIFSIGLVHEVLYGDQEAAELDVAVYLNRLCAMLDRVYAASERGISLQVEATGSLDLVRSVPVGLLVNELLSNALKHAFPDGRGGTVRLCFSAGDAYELMVSDDGVGMPANAEEQRTGSLGLTIIRALVQQLGATVERGTGPGTTQRIVFPI